MNKQFILSKEQKKIIDKDGFIIFPPNNFVLKNLKKIHKILENLITKEKSKAGWEGKEEYYKKGKPFEKGARRLGNLINKNDIFKELIVLPEIAQTSEYMVNNDIKIGAVDFRDPLIGTGNQIFHIDWLPRTKHKDPFESVLVQIVLDNTNKTNGPLRVVPGTHKKLGWPDDHIKNVNLTHKKEKLVFLKKGSIVVINGNLWHGGTGNISGNKRRIILIDIRNRNLPQLLNQKKYIDKKVLNNLNEYQKYLLGVRDIDKNQKEKSFGSGQAYRMKYGRKRD